MADDAEAGVAVGLQELVGMGPAVEVDGEAIGLKYPVDIGEGRGQPGIGVVARNAAAITRPIVGEVVRVGEYEVDAPSCSCGRTCKQSAVMMVLSAMVVMVSAPLASGGAPCDLLTARNSQAEPATGATGNLGFPRGRPKAGDDSHCACRAACVRGSGLEVADVFTKRKTDMY